MINKMFIAFVLVFSVSQISFASCYETNCRYETRKVGCGDNGKYCSGKLTEKVCDKICHDEHPGCEEICHDTNCRYETREVGCDDNGKYCNGKLTEKFCDKTCYNKCN